MRKIENQTFPGERALYDTENAEIIGCSFEGEEDGESALKECRNIAVTDCKFKLRYPLWHVQNAKITGSVMSETCRAALWYDKDIEIDDSELNGIKALRECENVTVTNSKIESQEFGWFCRGVKIKDSSLISEYPFMKTSDMEIDNLNMRGKYSFQYMKNVTIKNSYLDTKDAFWHSKNVTVIDSVVKGEYLAWYSEGLTLIRCKIIGTQPLCYAKNLKLVDCTMENCDLSFEKSEVEATVIGDIMSVKNPLSGRVIADSIGEIILDDKKRKSTCKIEIRKQL